MTSIYLFCVASVIISCVYSQYEDYPPYFKDHEPSIPKVKEGNYTDNHTCVFTVTASVRSSRVNVTIEPMKSEETSDMILLNCTHKNNDVTCRVYLIAAVDRERTQTLTFKFIAKSSNENAPPGYESVQLNLEDVNDESPVFDSPSYQILLPENYTVNSEVTGVTITAKDPDAGTAGQVFFSIEPSGQAANLYSGYFNISDSGTLFLKKELDYEKLTFLQYTIIAKDGGDGYQRHSSTAELLVKLRMYKTNHQFL